MSSSGPARNWEKDFLINELGFNQYKNTALFIKTNTLLYSPSVANKYNWFDLKEGNLEILDSKKYDNLFILLRLVNLNSFALLKYSEMLIIVGDKYRINKQGEKVWGFKYKVNAGGIYIWNIRNSSNKIYTEILNKAQAKTMLSTQMQNNNK